MHSIQSPYAPDQHTRYPLWVITFWVEVVPIHNAHDQWKMLIETLCERLKLKAPWSQDFALLERSLQMAPALLWGTRVPGFNVDVDMQYLSYFFTMQWLTDDHETLMLDLLQTEVACSPQHQSFVFASVFLHNWITGAFKNPVDYVIDQQLTWLRDLGNTYAESKSTVLTISNLNDNHWVAVVLDFNYRTIYYGDSFNRFPSLNTLSAFERWTHFHTGKDFKVMLLPTTHQTDRHSCGLLAWNALAHMVFPDRYQLFNASKVDNERLQLFLRIAEIPKVCSMIAISHLYY